MSGQWMPDPDQQFVVCTSDGPVELTPVGELRLLAGLEDWRLTGVLDPFRRVERFIGLEIVESPERSGIDHAISIRIEHDEGVV